MPLRAIIENDFYDARRLMPCYEIRLTVGLFIEVIVSFYSAILPCCTVLHFLF